METVVKKWGNSLGIRIPYLIVREFSMKDGSVVDIANNGREIIIRPAQKNRLAEMLSEITRQNTHKEIETGGAAGKETW